MKHILTILFFISLSASATDYYVSPSGNDGNAGTIGSPFRNWQKLSDVLTAGDVGYIRGGTYTPTTATNLYIHCHWINLNGTSQDPITISNYPGEVPVYDFTGFVPNEATGNTWAVFIELSEYVIVSGLRVTGLDQISGGAGVSRGWGFDISSNITISNCEVDHMGGAGFQINTNDCPNISFINCDSHHNSDPLSTPAYGGADGFDVNGSITNTSPTYFINCRAWWNSDDGFDNYSLDGTIFYRGCQAFWNGYIPGGFSTAGNGAGFKLGPTATDNSTNTLRFLYNNLAFENRTNGFDQNDGQCLYQVYNNTAYNNGVYGFEWAYYVGITQDLKNNASFGNGTADLHDAGGNAAGTTNTWSGVVTCNSSDFSSVSSTGMDGARNADGSLPGLSFLRLVAGSDLINAGTIVNLPYCGPTADMGADEFNSCPVNIIKRKTIIH